MNTSKTNDFKSNVADLTKIPPNEFEKYFQEWMERDDVARSLQAKLRCDLIKNFNKTNLGKHIISHTMSSTGGSSMRLTLSPLVLALNTLVAEFLYAQNCHFTLSVFCTEIPFRNTLPDFESMRKFRFNNEEIYEIWEAVTGSKANRKDLHKHVIHSYETNSNISLLLLLLKYLLKKDPLELHKRNAEVQTELQEKLNKSISAQASERENKTPPKTVPKDDNLKHINSYLLKLSDKVVEMTKEFEQFTKQRHESRSRNLKSARSREYYNLNKSLERITENMKVMAQSKRKNKRLSNVVESIDNLTQQFGKCAENFENVTKVLGSREKPVTSVEEKHKRAKVKVKEKQTETDFEEKSYAEWIHDMRNTENGQKFLNRVEISLRKALTKHREQLQNETDIKMKHLKSLMRLHYQQKLSKHLLHDPKINLEEALKCNDNIEKKLQQFETKQMELLQKLQESSKELKEAQQLQQQQQKQEDIPGEENNIPDKEQLQESAKVQNQNVKENEPKTVEILFKAQECQKPIDIKQNITDKVTHSTLENYSTRAKSVDQNVTLETPRSLLNDVSITQEKILDIAKTIAEEGRSVDHIIYDAKLRIQQLENESNQLELNFQSYLERRKRNREFDNENKNIYPIFKENLSTLTDLKQKITNARLMQDHKKTQALEEDQDEDLDEEFQRLKESMRQIEEPKDKPKSAKSESSTSSLEIKNAILEAKLKFFEHENTLRKCRDQGDEIRSGSLLQKQLEKYSEINELDNIQFGSRTNINDGTREVNLASSLSEISIKDKSLDGEQIIELSPFKDYESQNPGALTPLSVRRELFPKEDRNLDTKTSLAEDIQNNIRYYKPISQQSKNYEFQSRCYDLKTPTENTNEMTKQVLETYETLGTKKSDTPMLSTNNTSDLLKQSMAKMQELFKKQSESQETLREMVHEITQQRDLKIQDLQNISRFEIPQRHNEALDKSLITTVTSTNTTTVRTNTTQTSEEKQTKNQNQILKRISNTSLPSILNLSSDSEESLDAKHIELEVTQETIKDLEVDHKVTKEKIAEDVGHVFESYESSELRSLPALIKKSEDLEPNFEQEFGQIYDSPKIPDLNLTSPGEIGEVFSQSHRNFDAIDVKLSESSSAGSTSDLEISTGFQNKSAKNLADDSESDFWA